MLSELASKIEQAGVNNLQVLDAVEKLREGNARSGVRVSDYVRRPFRVLARSRIKVTFLLDEFGQTAKEECEIEPSFYGLLRDLTRHGVSYVIATRELLSTIEASLVEQEDTPTSFLHDIFHPVFVPLFFRQEARNTVNGLLDTAHQSQHVLEQFWPKYNGLLYELSGFHPFFLQILFDADTKTIDKGSLSRRSWPAF
jgi:hypothetical protein